MKRIGQVAVAAIALMAVARVASAQLPGIPYGMVETGTGFNLAADYGNPSNGSAYGVTGGFGFGRFGLSASVGSRDLGPTSGTTYGGRLGMRVFGGGLNPFSVGVQVGASQAKDLGSTAGTDATYVVPGAWAKFSPPLFPLKPYGQVYYLTGDNRPSGTDEVRFVLGMNFNLLFGFGLHAGYDWGDSGGLWGVGAHFSFKVPGIVPVI